MVNIEGLTAENIHRKLKMKKVQRLIKEVFGKKIKISENSNNLFITEKPKFLHNPFLKLYLNLGNPESNFFELKDRKYFDKTKELAEKYEQFFGGVIRLRLSYY